MGTTTKPTSWVWVLAWIAKVQPTPTPTGTHIHDPHGYAIPMQMPMPTQSPPSPIDFTMGSVHTADNFARTYLNWYTHSLCNANAVGPPPMPFIIRENFPSPAQTPITI